jgi:membrane dipeptidase
VSLRRNYYDKFVRDGGGWAGVEDILRHVHHFLELGGEDILALGSDFDGAAMPDYISGVEKIENLVNALPPDVADKILYKNANRFFGRENK